MMPRVSTLPKIPLCLGAAPRSRRRPRVVRLVRRPVVASSIRAAAGLPPTSPGLTTAPSSSTLKKSDSVESFGKRFKGIGKKIAGNRKEDKVCTVTPVVPASPSPRPAISMTATDTDAEPRVPAAHVRTQRQLEQKEGTPARSDDAVSSFFDIESASKQFVAFLDTFADALCKDGTSDDESQVWQRAYQLSLGWTPPSMLENNMRILTSSSSSRALSARIVQATQLRSDDPYPCRKIRTSVF